MTEIGQRSKVESQKRGYFPKAKRRTHAVTVRFNEKELEMVQNHLESPGEVIMADYCRRAILSHVCNTRRMEESLERRVEKRMLAHEMQKDAAECKMDASEQPGASKEHLDLRESSKEEKNTTMYISASATTSTRAPAREENVTPYIWLTDDEEALRKWCASNGLPTDAPLSTLGPYIDVFLDWLEEIGTDFALKGRVDTKKHFSAWLPRYINKQEKDTYGEYRRSFGEESRYSSRSEQSTPSQRSKQSQRSIQYVADVASACAAGLAAARVGKGLL